MLVIISRIVSINDNSSHYQGCFFEKQELHVKSKLILIIVNFTISLSFFSVYGELIMRTLRYMVMALFAILLVVIIVGLFLPAKVHLERSIEISHDKQTVFKVINSLSNFNKWSPWYEYDVNASYVISGAKSGVGSKIEWSGNQKVGTGSNEIIKSIQDSSIKTKFFFGKNDSPAFSIISLKQKGNITTATWAFENDFGYNVFYRYFGLVLEDMIAPDYERGLKKLKEHVESLPLYDYSMISVEQTLAEKSYAVEVSTSKKTTEISPIIASAYGAIVNYITAKGIVMTGSPKIVNLKNTDIIYEFLAVIPVENNKKIDSEGKIKAFSTYQGKAIKYIHKGSYENFVKSYSVIDAYLQQNNFEKAGNSWEDFVTDPGTTSEDLLITHIYQPIK